MVAPVHTTESTAAERTAPSIDPIEISIKAITRQISGLREQFQKENDPGALPLVLQGAWDHYDRYEHSVIDRISYIQRRIDHEVPPHRNQELTALLEAVKFSEALQAKMIAGVKCIQFAFDTFLFTTRELQEEYRAAVRRAAQIPKRIREVLTGRILFSIGQVQAALEGAVSRIRSGVLPIYLEMAWDIEVSFCYQVKKEVAGFEEMGLLTAEQCPRLPCFYANLSIFHVYNSLRLSPSFQGKELDMQALRRQFNHLPKRLLRTILKEALELIEQKEIQEDGTEKNLRTDQILENILIVLGKHIFADEYSEFAVGIHPDLLPPRAVQEEAAATVAEKARKESVGELLKPLYEVLSPYPLRRETIRASGQYETIQQVALRLIGELPEPLREALYEMVGNFYGIIERIIRPDARNYGETRVVEDLKITAQAVTLVHRSLIGHAHLEGQQALIRARLDVIRAERTTDSLIDSQQDIIDRLEEIVLLVVAMQTSIGAPSEEARQTALDFYSELELDTQRAIKRHYPDEDRQMLFDEGLFLDKENLRSFLSALKQMQLQIQQEIQKLMAGYHRPMLAVADAEEELATVFSGLLMDKLDYKVAISADAYAAAFDDDDEDSEEEDVLEEGPPPLLLSLAGLSTT